MLVTSARVSARSCKEIVFSQLLCRTRKRAFKSRMVSSYIHTCTRIAILFLIRGNARFATRASTPFNTRYPGGAECEASRKKKRLKRLTFARNGVPFYRLSEKSAAARLSSLSPFRELKARKDKRDPVRCITEMSDRTHRDAR